MLEKIKILSNLTVKQDSLVKYVQFKNKQVENLNTIAKAYTVYGAATGIGNVMPFAQAIHETGWFSSRRWLQNYNPAGIGATNDGAEGHIWTNPEQGILAQYAHLLAYTLNLGEEESTYQRLKLAQVSPRYSVLEKAKLLGVADTWVDLNGRWAWPGTTYAQRIARIAEEIVAFDTRT
jgi:N-acetylmuramoyl-L-alanine amidase